jgi:hypothetical protein
VCRYDARALLVYLNERMRRVRALRWEVGTGLPEVVGENLSHSVRAALHSLPGGVRLVTCTSSVARWTIELLREAIHPDALFRNTESASLKPRAHTGRHRLVF